MQRCSSKGYGGEILRTSQASTVLHVLALHLRPLSFPNLNEHNVGGPSNFNITSAISLIP